MVGITQDKGLDMSIQSAVDDLLRLRLVYDDLDNDLVRRIDAAILLIEYHRLRKISINPISVSVEDIPMLHDKMIKIHFGGYNGESFTELKTGEDTSIKTNLFVYVYSLNEVYIYVENIETHVSAVQVLDFSNIHELMRKAKDNNVQQ